jgi:hypothetical protein
MRRVAATAMDHDLEHRPGRIHDARADADDADRELLV